MLAYDSAFVTSRMIRKTFGRHFQQRGLRHVAEIYSNRTGWNEPANFQA
jgi:hypothetical protein